MGRTVRRMGRRGALAGVGVVVVGGLLGSLLAVSSFAESRNGTFRAYEVGPHEISAGFEETVDGADVIIAECVVPRSPDVVWRELTDYENHPAFFRFLTSSRLVDPTTLRQEGEAGALFFSYPFTVTFRLEERPKQTLRFFLIDGDFQQYSGGWTLFPDAGGTRLRYEASVLPKFYVPRWVMRIMIRNMTLDSSRAFIDRCLEQSDE